jgi:hypothetical protein
MIHRRINPLLRQTEHGAEGASRPERP